MINVFILTSWPLNPSNPIKYTCIVISSRMISPCNLQGGMHTPRPISPDWLLHLISLLLHKNKLISARKMTPGLRG